MGVRELGFRRMAEAVERNEDLFSVFSDIVKSRRVIRGDAVGDACNALLTAYIGLRNIGYAFSSQDPRLNGFLNMGSTGMAMEVSSNLVVKDVDLGLRQVQALCGAVQSVRKLREIRFPPC